VSENRPIAEEPIDRDNHALKALSYWLYAQYGPVDVGERKLSEAGYDRLAGVSKPQEADPVTLVRHNGALRFARQGRGVGSRRADLLRIKH
jgi:hypothetical protein